MISNGNKITFLFVLFYILLLCMYIFEWHNIRTLSSDIHNEINYTNITDSYTRNNESMHSITPTLQILSVTHTREPISQSPTLVATSVYTMTPILLSNITAESQIPSIISTKESISEIAIISQILEVPGEWQWVKLPLEIDYSKYMLNTSSIQGDKLYIHDAQWIPTMSCIMLVILNRNEKGARPPNRGGNLFVSISSFLPSVNISIKTQTGNKTLSFINIKCSDIDDADLDAVRLLSMLVCYLPQLSLPPFETMYIQFRELNVIIPMDTGSASSYFGDKISRRSPPPPKSSKSTIGACIGGVNRNALPYLREFVQYYLLIGVSHIYLSFGANYLFDDNTTFLEEMVADFIKQGLVSIVPGPIAFPLLEPAFVDAYSKVPFYQSCMWHSKAYDKYTIVVDVDEYVMLYGNQTTKTLGDALNEIVNKNEVLCGIELIDYVSCERENNSKWIGEAFTGREIKSHNSRKTIILTQKANWAWLHRPFRCESDIRQLSNIEGLYSTKEFIYMLHVAHLFVERGPTFLRYPPYIPNEYTSYWFTRVRNSLAKRCVGMMMTTQTITKYCDDMW